MPEAIGALSPNMQSAEEAATSGLRPDATFPWPLDSAAGRAFLEHFCGERRLPMSEQLSVIEALPAFDRHGLSASVPRPNRGRPAQRLPQ